jgi:putative ABC transport system substrate-binding protein
MKPRTERHLSRRGFVRTVAGLGLATAGLPLLGACGGSVPAAREVPPPARVYRIGWMTEGEPASESTPMNWPSPLDARTKSFVDRLTELGYVEGRNLHWEWRRAPPDELAAAAAELMRLDLDLILILGSTLALRAAAHAPGDTPVVFGGSATDPVGMGYAQSMARPGGKVTGVTPGSPTVQYGPKWVEVLKDVLPTLTRLGVVYDADAEAPFDPLEAVRARLLPATRELGVELDFAEVRTLEELDGAWDALARAGAEAALPMLRTRWHQRETRLRLIADALQRRLPLLGPVREWVVDGALVAYQIDFLALWARVAEYVDLVLRGAKPGDLPIEQPNKYDLILNLRTAQTLGLTVSPAVIARATEVIQ